MTEYTKEELLKIIEVAESRGDTEYAAKMRARLPKETNAALGAARSFTEGMTFGWGDELGIAAAATAAALTHPDKTWTEIYADMKSAYDYERGKFREEHPVLSTTADVAGGLATGVAGASRVAGSKVLKSIPKIIRYPGSGAAAGGTAGAGYSKPGERLEGGAKGAAAGAALSALLPVAGHLAKPTVRRLMREYDPTIHRRAASRELAEAFDYDDMSGRDVMRRMTRMGGDDLEPSGHSPAMIADAGGENVLGAGRSAMSQPFKGKNRVRNVLETRDKGTAGRLSSKLDEMIEAPGSPRAVMAEVRQQLKKESKPLYRRAYKQKISDEEYAELMENPVLQWAAERVQRNPRARAALGGYAPSSLKTLDIMKRFLDDAWRKAHRAGRTDLDAREILKAKHALLRVADRASARQARSGVASGSPYAKARATYGGKAQSMEAFEQGRRILKDPDSVTDEFLDTMKKGDHAFFRLGAKDAILEQIESAGYSHDTVKRLINSPKMAKRLRRAFPSDQRYRQFKRELLRESRKRLTKDKTMGGSPTARIQAEQAQSMGHRMAAEAGLDAVTGQPFGVARFGLRELLTPEAGLDSRQAAEVARMLYSRDPAVQRQAVMLIDKMQRRGLLGDPSLGTGVGSLGAPAAAGGILAE